MMVDYFSSFAQEASCMDSNKLSSKPNTPDLKKIPVFDVATASARILLHCTKCFTFATVTVDCNLLHW